jgi:hypothetical protein
MECNGSGLSGPLEQLAADLEVSAAHVGRGEDEDEA